VGDVPVSAMSVIATPSSVQTASCGRVPLVAKFDCWPVSLPPTLTRSTSTPGTVRISENGSREVGIFESSSAVKFVAVPVCLASTIGEGALTVIVSVTALICIATGTLTVLPRSSTTFSRTSVAKPCSAAVTL
jgi:hypothetical protein